MERISVSVRQPTKETLKIMCQQEDRPISDMANILIEEAIAYRLKPKPRRISRPGSFRPGQVYNETTGQFDNINAVAE